MNAAYTNANNGARPANQRISTHPSYTEYSWESLASRGRAGQPAQSAGAQNAQVQNPRAGQNARVNGARDSIQQNPQARGRAAYAAAAGVARSGTAQPRTGVSAHPGQRTRGKTSGNTRADTTKKANAAKSAARTKAAQDALKKQAANAEKLRRKSIVAIHTIVVEKKYAFPMAVVLIALCFTIIILAIVTTSVQISEITSQNSDLQRTYNSLVSEENELRLRLETRDDLRVVESMAKEELGMVKKDEVDRYYLTVRKEDRIEILEAEEKERISILESVMSFGGSLVERIRAFFGM